jgi:hypothetical protein
LFQQVERKEFCEKKKKKKKKGLDSPDFEKSIQISPYFFNSLDIAYLVKINKKRIFNFHIWSIAKFG